MDPNSLQSSPLSTSPTPIDPEIQQLSQTTEIDPATIPTHSHAMKYIIWGLVVVLLMLSSGSVGYLVGVKQTELKLLVR
jgi:hypothetical protein